MEPGLFTRIGRILRNNIESTVIMTVSLTVLYAVSLYGYHLFHALVELYSVLIAFTVFVLTWNTRKIINNGYLLFLGISLLCIGGLDLLHMLAYQGMGVFPGTGLTDEGGANLATQLWLAARYVQSLSLVIAPFFVKRAFNPRLLLVIFGGTAALLLASIFVWPIFPTAFLDGLTPFKVISEYVIIGLFLIAMGRLLQIRSAFPRDVLGLLLASMIVNVVAEYAFTEYGGVFDWMNVIGHLLKVVSFYLVYKAIVETGLRKPQEVLYHELAQNEQALREASALERARAAQLEAIMEAVPAVVWIAHDAEARNVTGNQIASDILRMPQDANLSKSAPDGQAPQHFRVYKNGRELKAEELPLQLSAATGKPVRNFEELIVFDDGTELYLFGNVTPLLDDSGRPAGAVGAFLDITNRVIIEQALQYSEQRYRNLFESITEGFLLQEIIFDEQGNPYDYRILDVNPVFERMTRLRREHVIGRTIRRLLPDIEPEWIDSYAAVACTGEPQRFELYAASLDLYFEVILYRVDQQQIATLTIDITARRKGQEALQKSEARLRRLVESNIIGVIYGDAQGNIDLANDAFLDIIGYRREDIEGRQLNWRDITPPEFFSADEAGRVEASRRGACTPYEKAFYRKDGTRVPVIIGFAYFDEPGETHISFVVDLTEQKRAEAAAKEYAAQLEQSNRELQDFAFVASHDLQEPLRKIHAFGERLHNRLTGTLDPDTQDYLLRIMSASQRMRNMVNDLLSLSRVMTRGKPFEQVDLNEVAREVISDLELRIERTGAEIKVHSLPVIEADTTQMHQLLQNLLVNALKFQRIDARPQVKLYSDYHLETKRVKIIVEDNGIGFEEQYLDRIFQPFQRLHSRTEYEGSGIGLAVCRRIAERHGGMITARSVPGQGSIFTVVLPNSLSTRSGVSV